MHILPKRQRCILCRIYIPRYATEAAPGYETEPALEMTLMPKLSGQAYAQTSVEKTQQSIQNNLSQSQPAQPVAVQPQAAMQQSVQMSYVDMENLKGMAKTKIMADDREGACAIFMQLSAAGDCNAMYTEISKIYNSNKEVKKNPEAAIFWYQKCIETIKDSWTVSLAENRLGEIYSNGLGVKKDHELAEKYYRSSASKGNPYAKKKFVAGKYVK